MKEITWDISIRIAGIAFSIAILVISIFFSSWGFSFDMNNYSWALWVSLTLGASVTIIELNGYKTEKKDPAFLLIWILAYFYGAYTNCVGLIQVRGAVPPTWDSYILPILVGLFIEIVPEKLFIKSLRELNALRGQRPNGKNDFFRSSNNEQNAKPYIPTHRPITMTAKSYDKKPPSRGFVPVNYESDD